MSSNLSPKYEAELDFWRNEIGWYVKWFLGNVPELYGVPAPTPNERITRYDSIQRNALETWVNADKWRYCKRLFIEPTYFSGKCVLEVGCGPLGLHRFLAGAEVNGLDPLWEYYPPAYSDLNYKDIMVVPCRLEDAATYDGPINFAVQDNYYNAAYSVNAIDHVDDFEAAITQLERLVDKDGEIRIETHLHEATTTEPMVLTVERVAKAFKKFRMKPIASNPSSYFYPLGTHPASDRFVLWSNRDYLYQGWKPFGA